MAVGVQVRYAGRVYATATGDGAGQTMDGTYTVDRYLPDRPYGVHIPADWARELNDQKESNHESHKRIWEKNEEQDGKLADHEARITLLEDRR